MTPPPLPQMSQILRNCVARVVGVRQGVLLQQERFITKSVPSRCKDSVTKAKPEVDGASLRTAYRPNRFEQRMLVWTKKYKSLAEVPAAVT